MDKIDKGRDKEQIISARYRRIVQIVSPAVFVIFIVAGTFLCIPLIKALKTEEGIQRIHEALSSYSGVWGVIIFVLLQALQVIIAIVPPVQIIGGLLFGWLWGAALSFAGTMLGSFIVFSLVRRLGAPLAEAFVSEKHFTKFRFLQDKRKLTGVLMILYLIPGIPKDVITYIVPLTKISRRDFFLYVMPCRLPAIVMSTLLGSNVGSGNLKAAIIVVAAFFVIAILGVIFREPILNRLKHQKKNDK